jgi:hypothetical protein
MNQNLTDRLPIEIYTPKRICQSTILGYCPGYAHTPSRQQGPPIVHMLRKS